MFNFSGRLNKSSEARLNGGQRMSKLKVVASYLSDERQKLRPLNMRQKIFNLHRSIYKIFKKKDNLRRTYLQKKKLKSK